MPMGYGFYSQLPAATPNTPPPSPAPMQALASALRPYVTKTKALQIAEFLLDNYNVLDKAGNPLVPLNNDKIITTVGSMCSHGMGTPPCPIQPDCVQTPVYAYEPPLTTDEPDPEKQRHLLPPSATPISWLDTIFG